MLLTECEILNILKQVNTRAKHLKGIASVDLLLQVHLNVRSYSVWGKNSLFFTRKGATWKDVGPAS